MNGSDFSHLPAAFIRTILEVFGARGERWLRQLPELLAACERRWDVRLGPPFDLSYNYVAPAAGKEGAAFVVKAGVPHSRTAERDARPAAL